METLYAINKQQYLGDAHNALKSIPMRIGFNHIRNPELEDSD